MREALDLLREPPDLAPLDQRVLLRGVRFDQYVALADARAESAVPRMTYLEGDLEIMSPSPEHESTAKLWARLLEAWAEEAGVELVGFKSWTIRQRRGRRGLEPDECYVVGVRRAKAPDLALEVVRTSPLVDKLEVYRGLGVPEVWVWRSGRISVHVLRNGRYERVEESRLLRGLDLALLARFLERQDQTQAVREFRAALRPRRR